MAWGLARKAAASAAFLGASFWSAKEGDPNIAAGVHNAFAGWTPPSKRSGAALQGSDAALQGSKFLPVMNLVPKVR